MGNENLIDRSKMGASAMFWNDEKDITERMKIRKEKEKKLGLAMGFYVGCMGLMYLFL